MTRIIILFVSMLLVTALAALSANPQTDSIELMTFNIRMGIADDGENHWDKRHELVFDVFRYHSPDIVGVQEAFQFQLEEILNNVDGYAKTGVGRKDGDSLGEYSAILYKKDRLRLLSSDTFWFSDTPQEPGSTSWGNTIPRICTWAHFFDDSLKRSFYVYNLHLDHQSQPSREKSVEFLLQRVRERETKDPVVLMGDFNAGETNPAIQPIKEFKQIAENDTVEFRDSYRVIHPNAQEVGTFNAFEGKTSGEKIDHIFVSSDFFVLNAGILHDNENGRYPSDHFPVVTTVQFED